VVTEGRSRTWLVLRQAAGSQWGPPIGNAGRASSVPRSSAPGLLVESAPAPGQEEPGGRQHGRGLGPDRGDWRRSSGVSRLGGSTLDGSGGSGFDSRLLGYLPALSFDGDNDTYPERLLSGFE
jgi:hypothetical protein